ncbi:MAG: hypothetical protein GXP27_09295 [Planctomycetes bacterium]|nr:hypothetical protein [Planctomycetota bacterium]
MIHEFARYLLRKKRKSQAYVLLRDGLLSVPNERDETAALRYQTLGSAYQADGVVVTALGRLANLAHELAKTDELKRQLSELARERPKGKPLCELLAAMLERRAGNERPLEEIGRRYLENQQFARSLAPYYNSLREELASCATESALRVALEVWTKPSPRVPGVVVYLAPSSTAVRVAAIHMKLKQREQARQALLKGLDVKFPVSMSPQSAAEQTIQRQLPIANALREYGFLLEAIDVYQRILRQMPDVRRNSYTRRYQGRQASQAIQQCVAQLIGPKRDATLNALLAELKRESPDLERFFAVCDPSLPDSSGSYRPSRATSPDANTLATAQAQLLPALLQHAHKSGKLTTIQKVLAERIQKSSSKPHQTPESAADQNTGVAAGPTRLRLDALRILAICSGETPDQAVPSLQDWLDRVEKKKQLAERPETWLLALAALDRPATRTLGQRLAAAVFRSAARTGNSSRQQAALAALARSGAETDALVQQIMVDRKGDPEALYQVAQAYYQQRKYAKAVEALKPVWQRAPELLMPRLRYLADYYVKADRLKNLADAIRSVRDTNLLGRYAYELGNLIAKLPRDPEHARSVIELYFAWGEAADGAASTYQASRLASYLSRLPRDENTLGLYRLVVFPSKRHGGSLENFAGQMVELAQATGRLQALRRDCRRGMDAFPQWKAKGELLLAMLELRLGDEEPMNQIARKYKTDPAFAAQLASEVTLLRGELAQCEGRPAAELALELWQPLMANEEGGATSATVQVAKLLGKLGQRDKARQVLLNRLRKPFAVTFTAEEDYLTRLKLREKQDLGQELARQGFPIDALRAYASALASDTSRIATDSFTRQTVNQMREAARQLIQQTASKDVDSLLTQLQISLDERNPGKAMTPFFIVIDHVPDVVSPPTSSPVAPDAILPLLLEHAKRKGKLAELKLQVAEARKTRGQDHRLIALDVLIRLAEGDTVAALAVLERLDQRARESRRSIDDALWLATREALKADATNRTARALAERIAEAAGRANNLIRQEAAAVALANARAAGDQGEGVSELMRALIVGKSRDPETQLQLARVLFRQNRGVEAADTLAPIWKRHPGVLLKSIEELARLYAQTGQTDRLSEALKSVTDDEARRRYRYDVTNAAIALANDKQYADEAITILRAAVRFTPAENREYPLNHLGNLLIQQGRKAEAWQTYCQTVIPPQGPADRLPDSAISLASLTVKIGKFDELTRLCQRAVKTHPQWQNCAELLVAMARFQKNKDEMALQEIARRFQTDPNYAQSLRASASVLRSQFAVLSGKPALEVAAELWQTELDRTKARGPTGRTVQYSFYSYGSFADVLIKMGHREKARNVLLDALASDTTGHASAFRDFYLLQRSTYLAPRLLKADYPLDALRLLQQDVKLEGSPLAREPRVANQIARRQRILRSAVLQTLTGDLDTALQALQKTLEEPEPAELATFFSVAAPKWTTQEIERIPTHVRLEPASQTQLLPALLRHAREKGRLDELAEMAASARKSGPNNERLTALTVFIQDARGGQDALGALIALSRNDDKDLRQLAIACLMRYRSPTAAQAIEAARQASP